MIRCAPGEHDRVLQLIEQFRPIDIDEHASKWRAAGWSGRAEGTQEMPRRQLRFETEIRQLQLMFQAVAHEVANLTQPAQSAR